MYPAVVHVSITTAINIQQVSRTRPPRNRYSTTLNFEYDGVGNFYDQMNKAIAQYCDSLTEEVTSTFVSVAYAIVNGENKYFVAHGAD